jgi:YVTN family beta-propeller protein
MRKIYHLTIYTLIAIAFTGCMDDEVMPVSPIDLYGSRGVFIVNEGNYLYGNSSLSYYDINTKEVINDIFSVANGIPLGDVAYSMVIRNGKGYIVVNNSGCIHVVDANTILLEKTIEGLTSPRNILFLNDNTALVSDLYARGISIVDLLRNKVVGKIKTGSLSMPFYQHPTENLLQIGNRIFTNCWSYDNKVLVIDAESLAVVDSVEVGIQPLQMLADANGKIWVMNDGGYFGSPFGAEKPSLMRLNPQTLEVEMRLNFASQMDRLGQMATNPAGDTLYYICNHLFRMPISSETLQVTPFVSRSGRNFRALGIDPNTGNIFISDASDYTSEGSIYVYKPSGSPVDTFSVGIIPTSFCFN